MDLRVHPCLEDLVSALPVDAEEHRRRMRRACLAVLRVAPHLKSGRAGDVGANDLRTIFLALDLLVFGSRYRTAFENDHPVAFVWYLETGAEGPDCWLEYVPVVDISEGPEVLEFHVAPAKCVSEEVEVGWPVLLDRVAGAMLRLMILGASSFVETDTGNGIAQAARLLKRLRFESEPG